MFLKFQILFSSFRIALLFCLISVTSYAQEQPYSAKVASAVETYAFLRGQSAALNEIAKQFPQLKPEVASAEKKMKGTFYRAEKNIEKFLQSELQISHFKILKKQIDSLLQVQFKKPIEKEKYARDFLKKANERVYAINDTILHKRIMSFIYHDAPHEEINDGHLNFFLTENHPKAQKADLKIPVPKSWLAEEAESPQTIQQFTSFNGTGIEKILLTAYDLPDHLDGITLNKKTVSEMLSPESNLIRSEPATIDDIPGMMIEVEEHFNIGDSPMKIRMLQFMFVQDKKLYCIQGSVGPVETKINLEMHLKKYEPLFRLIAANTEIEN